MHCVTYRLFAYAEMLGNFVENGEYPDDEETLAKIVKDISFNNAKAYFGI